MSFRRQDKFYVLTPQMLLLLGYCSFLLCTMLSSPNQGVASQTIVYSCGRDTGKCLSVYPGMSSGLGRTAWG